MYPAEARFIEVCAALDLHVERRHGIPVVISDVANSFTGDLDGSEIRVDYERSAEDSVFIVAHLFGHAAQWNLSESARTLGSLGQAHPTEERLRELEASEREACCYSAQILHDAGVRDLDPWLADFAACDSAHLRHFHATGEKRAFRSIRREGQPLLASLAIPEFHPTRRLSRWQGIVV